jgi:hypothetical protein
MLENKARRLAASTQPLFGERALSQTATVARRSLCFACLTPSSLGQPESTIVCNETPLKRGFRYNVFNGFLILCRYRAAGACPEYRRPGSTRPSGTHRVSALRVTLPHAGKTTGSRQETRVPITVMTGSRFLARRNTQLNGILADHSPKA